MNKKSKSQESECLLQSSIAYQSTRSVQYEYVTWACLRYTIHNTSASSSATSTTVSSIGCIAVLGILMLIFLSHTLLILTLTCYNILIFSFINFPPDRLVRYIFLLIQR